LINQFVYFNCPPAGLAVPISCGIALPTYSDGIYSLPVILIYQVATKRAVEIGTSGTWVAKMRPCNLPYSDSKFGEVVSVKPVPTATASDFIYWWGYVY